MILTVTMNPSIDISYPMDELKIDTVNRVSDVSKTAGGKGLNVTRVLTECGEEVIATGLIGGAIGQFLIDNLSERTVPSFFKISENTRNCIAILHDGHQTEILEAGPTVTEAESQIFLAHFSDLMEKVEVVSISGSLPSGVPVDYYIQLVKIASEANKKVVLDCSGKSLEAVLKSDFKPTVIKPNNEELSQLLGREVSKDLGDLKETLQDKLFEGIEWIVVSLGADGCFAKHWDTFYKVDIPQITVVNPVGSGDSTVAGISLGLNDNANDENLLKQANVLGMLNAQEKMTGHVNLENYEYLFELVNVKEV